MIPDVLDTNSMHIGIAYDQRTASHTCEKMGEYTPCRARCDNQQKPPAITWAIIREVLTPREVEELPHP